MCKYNILPGVNGQWLAVTVELSPCYWDIIHVDVSVNVNIPHQPQQVNTDPPSSVISACVDGLVYDIGVGCVIFSD